MYYASTKQYLPSVLSYLSISTLSNDLGLLDLRFPLHTKVSETYTNTITRLKIDALKIIGILKGLIG